MKKLYAVPICLFICRIIFSQTPPGIEWQNTLGGNLTETLYSIDQTIDGGYIIGGTSSSSISGDKTEASMGSVDFWIVKLDASGNISWQNTIGGYNTDYLKRIQQTSDGGYILAGQSSSGISGDKTVGPLTSSDYWIVKIDSEGSIEWQKVLGGTIGEALTDLEITPDGGYIAVGYSFSGISGNKTEANIGKSDFWVVKLDSIGNIEWQNSIGTSEYDVLMSVTVVDDGGYLLGGHSDGGVSGDKTEPNYGSDDIWIIKLDHDGAIQWQNSIGTSSTDYLVDIEKTIDGRYIMSGSTRSGINGDKTTESFGDFDYWIIKLDTDGSIIWDYTLGGNGLDAVGSIAVTSDGSYLISGYSYSDSSGNKLSHSKGIIDYWIVKLNDSHIIEWQEDIGGSDEDYLYDLALTSDGGSILGGRSRSPISGDKTESTNGEFDYWVIKLFPDEVFCSIISTITPLGATSFCTGENVTLNAPEDVSYTYQWKKNGVNISGATASSFTANNTGQYQVYISNGTCDDTSDSISVVKNPKPNPTINNLDATNDLCFDTSIKLKTATGSGYSYQWYKGASAISGATSNVYMATTPGNYKAKVTNSFGCFKTSAPYSIIKTCKLADAELNPAITIYPNPSNGSFTLDFRGMPISETMQISIMNMIGEVVYSEQVSDPENIHQMELKNSLPNGPYIVEIRSADQIFSEQIVIAK